MSIAYVTDVVRGASVRDRRAGSLLDEWPPKCLAVHEIAGQTMRNPIELERLVGTTLAETSFVLRKIVLFYIGMNNNFILLKYFHIFIMSWIIKNQILHHCDLMIHKIAQLVSNILTNIKVLILSVSFYFYYT